MAALIWKGSRQNGFENPEPWFGLKIRGGLVGHNLPLSPLIVLVNCQNLEEGALCVKTGFYADISWELVPLGMKMLQWNKRLSSLLQDFVSFWSTLSTPSERDAWKELKLPKFGKQCLKLSFFLWFFDGIIFVKQIGLGSAKTLKKYRFRRLCQFPCELRGENVVLPNFSTAYLHYCSWLLLVPN